MGKKEKLNGAEGFNTYYSQIYGERWNNIKNAFTNESAYTKFEIKGHDVPQEEIYFLDKASFFAASILPLENASTILDMCAAPGGKSLVIASRMEDNATLVCNERSAERRNRLIKNLKLQLPESIYSRTSVTGYDGSLLCRNNREVYDRIFLDAPCSSERHVFNSLPHLQQWTAARTKNLSFTQWSLLSSAFLLLKENGILVYATCSLSPEENDKVVEKLLKKYKNAEILPFDAKHLDAHSLGVNSLEVSDLINELELVVEKTSVGYHILPDVSKDAGPIYFSLVKKIILV